MKQNKVKKIYRKKLPKELDINTEHHKLIRELATIFQDDQLKKILKKCYINVRKYGAEAIIESLDNICVLCFWELIREMEVQSIFAASLFVYDHAKILKRNAAFLIEASEAVEDYDLATLEQMKAAFEKGNYNDVITFAYLHDKSRREITRSREDKQEIPEIPSFNPTKKIFDFLNEIIEEEVIEEGDDEAIYYLVGALRELNAPLTYNNRAQAKLKIHKALDYLDTKGNNGKKTR